MTGGKKWSKSSKTAAKAFHGKIKIVRQQPVVPVGTRLLAGDVVRIFLPAPGHGHAAPVVGELVRKVLASVTRAGASPSLVVLPSGTGRLRENPFALTGVRYPDRKLVEDAVDAWVASFRKAAGRVLPPVVLGIDCDTVSEPDGQAREYGGAIQLAVTIPSDVGAEVTITWKSLPTPGERPGLVTLWGDPSTKPPAVALDDNRPIASLGGRRALTLVCHDATAFSGRATYAANPGTWSGEIQRQYDLLCNVDPRGFSMAIHLIHCLPRRRRLDRMTSPVFQNAHNVLTGNNYDVPVVAVAGLNPSCPVRAFRTLHTQLACSFRHVDVMVRVR